MAALRRPQQSSSPSSASKTQQYHHHPAPLLPPPSAKSVRKRRRSPSPQSDDGSGAEDSWPRSKRVTQLNPASPLSSSPPYKASTIKQEQRRSYGSHKKGKRQVLMHDSTTEDITTSSVPSVKRTRLPSVAACKFAKAGCPFTGSQEQVKLHEDTYCSPMYQQLAHYKMLAARNPPSVSPHATSSKLPGTDDTHAEYSLASFVASSSKGLLLQSASPDSQALHAQIQRLQRDLHRAQSQLEEEKILRTERLRKASERCLELMSLSELGEGKVEVLRMKLKAERELREKLEEELESMRAADTARRRSQ